MKAGAQKINPVAFCFLILAVVGLNAHPALAQTNEACPPTPRVVPIGGPSVTAQQVEGGASLQTFMQDARTAFKAAAAANRATGLHFGCLIRQEGGPWRSGSTYLVQLAPTSRVFLHAKNMALSGNLLNRGIFAAILTSLGVNPQNATYLTDLRGKANDAPVSFNAGPGRSGYASAYVGTRGPIILLAGFDLNASHLAPEQIDHGDPTIRAQDVVDRRTLKAFVANAIDQFREFGRTGGREGLSKAKVAFRDPNGPWRHGSVYLYILDLSSNIILFHGAFPDRFEVRTLIPTQRDAVTGELILPQVLNAAKSSPEGGFVQYYFDDPIDEGDSANIPKVGYAREFEARRGADNSLARYIIGSGFYLSDPGVIAHRQTLAIKAIQPQVMRAMTASTVDAVSNRIERAISDDASQTQGLNFGGASSLSDALLAHGQSLENGTFDLGQLLAEASFTLPLNATSTGKRLFRNATIWGNGDY